MFGGFLLLFFFSFLVFKFQNIYHTPTNCDTSVISPLPPFYHHEFHEISKSINLSSYCFLTL